MSLDRSAVVLLVALCAPLGGAAAPDARPRPELRARAYAFVGEAGYCGAGYPAGSPIVTAEWLDGMGLPDPGSPRRSGLLLSKNGPTADCSAAVARITGVAGATLGELGFDFRNGSHCGGGAPRFGVVSREGFYYFVGCASGTFTEAPSDPQQWTRVRFGAGAFVPADPQAPPFELDVTVVERLYIVFDEGTDAPSAEDPTGVGLAILDNIDVDGQVITGAN